MGFIFGVVQMVMYIIYKDVKVLKEEVKLPEHAAVAAAAAAAKLNEIVVVDLQAIVEETVKGEKAKEGEIKETVQMCPV